MVNTKDEGIPFLVETDASDRAIAAFSLEPLVNLGILQLKWEPMPYTRL